MGTRYVKADKAVQMMVAELVQQHHADLAHVEAKIGVLFYEKTDRHGELVAGLKLHGYGAFATVKVTSLKNRVAGMPDALIVIDAQPWRERLDAQEKLALLDHELEHLRVKCEGGVTGVIDPETGEVVGVPEYDAHGRPKLWCKLHDWQLGGFRAIAQRWKGRALEVQAIRACVDERGQFVWEFAKQ